MRTSKPSLSFSKRESFSSIFRNLRRCKTARNDCRQSSQFAVGAGSDSNRLAMAVPWASGMLWLRETNTCRYSGFDYLYYAPLLQFCHYAVAQPLDLIGEAAAQLLIRRMEGDREGFPATIVLEPSIHVMKENGGIVSGGKLKASLYDHSPRFNKVFS